EVLGERHPDTLISLNNYAGVLESLGRAGEAEPLYKRALALRTEVLGERHPDTLISLNNYAGVLESLGRAGEAEPLYKRALALRTEVLGERHPDTLISLNNYAFVLRALDRAGEAEPLYKRALDLSTEVLGERHPDTLAVALNHVAILLRLDRTGEAVEVLARRIDDLHDWSGDEIRAMVREVGRRQVATRKSSWIDVILSVAIERPAERHADLAAQSVLRWKHRVTEEDARIERLVRRSGDPEIRRRAAEIAVMRRTVAKLARGDDTAAFGKAIEQLDKDMEALRRHGGVLDEWTPSRTITPADLVRHLPGGAALVEFRVFNPVDFSTGTFGSLRLAAVVFGGGEPVTIHDAGPADEIAIQVTAAMGGDRAASRALYDRLFGPVDARLRAASMVYVAPDGPLWALAPSVLRVSAEGGERWWIERQPVRVVATGRDLMAAAPETAAQAVVLLGGVDYGEGKAGGVPSGFAEGPATALRGRGLTLKPLEALPATHVEIGRIASFFRVPDLRSPVTEWRAAEATESRLKGLAEPPRVLHLATHGDYRAVMGTDRPETFSWVALAGANRGLKGGVDADGEDGLLTAMEAVGLDLEGTALVTRGDSTHILRE
ncbi:MAG: tetratricopeptide repeat protein, partial [Alphaproteobacteria bacterium]|nr:tetratricopeptide repeat protein [Alphaproteobacteria bacterium]